MNLPYFRYFIGDQLKAKMGMDHEQKGLYGDFLDLSWEHDPPGMLPNDDVWLASMARVSLARWRTLKPIVLRAWTRKGKWLVHAALVTEYERALHLSASGKQAVEAREAKKLRLIGRSSGDHRTIISSESSSEPSSEPSLLPITNTHTLLKSADDVSVCLVSPQEQEAANQEQNAKHEQHTERVRAAFELFWAAYPNKVAKVDAEAWFYKYQHPITPNLLSDMELAIKRQLKSMRWRKDYGRWIPEPAHWLEKRRWEDEGVKMPRRLEY